ncbi:MAG: peptidoglycan DD-metalloendopeptidase family protein [Rhodobacteraceae bacterium]|nr:peptidoglycan DD-metalloendopeptidase family protein [Paracoccaceae bacterium]
MKQLLAQLNHRLERHLPEQRLFLRSETTTRFVRLRPMTQAIALASVTSFFAWGIIATSILLMDSIGSGTLRDHAVRDQANYEQRLNDLAAERDQRAIETEAAQARFAEAMTRISDMQLQLLASEERRLELETGIDNIQHTIRRVVRERDEARARLAEVTNTLQAETGTTQTSADRARETEDMLDYLLVAMDKMAGSTRELTLDAEQSVNQARHLALENELLRDRNHMIFSQLEEALEMVVEPLERVFRAAGVTPEQIRRLVRQGANSQTASLRPISVSTSGVMAQDQDIARANAVLQRLADIHAYRLGINRMPVARPVSANVRETSGFGMRRHPLTGRSTMHNGLDWAGSRGTAIHATADGVVKSAGRQGGYGNLVVIEHDFGIETYYAHLNSLDVRAGQRVSRGQRIGGMGTTGASTGVHLHYEVRINGRPVNPITYIRAGQHVF